MGLDFHETAIVSVPIFMRNPVSTNSVNVSDTLHPHEETCDRPPCAVYGAARHFPISEDKVLGPKSPYGLKN